MSDVVSVVVVVFLAASAVSQLYSGRALHRMAEIVSDLIVTNEELIETANSLIDLAARPRTEPRHRTPSE